MSAKIHIERMMHRNTIAVKGESAASYALIKLIPTGEAPTKPLGLNLALVVDVSGSMYEEDGTNVSRLQRVKQAALRALDVLKPEDTLCVVAFAQGAQVVLPPTPFAQRSKIEDVLNRIDLFDVDPGGTTMDEGMRLALEALAGNLGEGKLSQMVVLTDGETSGERKCRELATQAAQNKICVTMMGVGTEWNANLIKDLAQLGGGKWYYIEAEQAQATERVFLEEFSHLASATFTNVQLHIRPIKDVRLKRVRQVVPEIKELPIQTVDDRHLVADLGTLERDKPTRYILDLSLPPRPDGNFIIAQVEVTYQVGGQNDTTGLVPLQIQYAQAGMGYINAEVAKHIDEVQLYELNNVLQQAIAQQNVAEIQRTAEAIKKKGQLMGPRAAKKTMLARQALDELHKGGRVSKKTQLALADSLRLAEEMPLPDAS